MQTYLPYPSLEDSVNTYERFALSRVRRSIVRVLDVLHETDGVMIPPNHPEVNRWRGHEPFLCEFGFVVNRFTEESWSRVMAPQPATTRNTDFYDRRLSHHLECATSAEFTLDPPAWWGTADIHIADQAELLRLDYDHYSKFFEGVPLSTPPHWMFRG